jgi:carbon-monoxide dehydrogenase large subunit
LKTNSYIGSPILRVEDERFLRGLGRFTDDLTRRGQWHAAVVRSAVAHGRIRAIDVSRAMNMRGVHAVITADDIGTPIPVIPFRRPNPAIAPYAQPVIAREVVRYAGEPIALVLADIPDRAQDAAAAISADIDFVPPVLDRETALHGNVPLFKDAGNCACTFTAAKNDGATSFAAAAHNVRGSFRVQRMTAVPMEPRALLAEWDESSGKLTVSGAAKLPFFNRRALATMLGLPETSVDYIEYDVGDGFGARGEFYPEDFLVAYAARKFGHPVKWTEDRREHFLAIAHSRETECDVEIALDSDGGILALRGDIYVDIGAYVRPNGMTPVRNTAQFLAGPYRVPNIDLRAHAFVSNKVPSGTYRGPGRFESCFFIERLLELAAAKTGIDPLQLRRRNLLRAGEMPYRLASLEPNDGFGMTSCDSGDYVETFDRCLQEFHWDDKAKISGQCADGRYYGVGIACFIEGGGSGPREHAAIDVTANGEIVLRVGSSAVGQGIETIFAQIAADALEAPIGRIRVEHGSTNLLAEGFGSYGSRSTVMGGSAIVAAAEKLLAQFRIATAKRLDVPSDKLIVSEATARAPDGRSLSLFDVPLSVEANFSNGSKATYSYGTAAAHVAVDPETGHAEVLDYTVCDDVGRIINPHTLHGQVIGAAVQGLGSVFSEEIIYDAAGQCLSASLADYLVPIATDYPRLHAISLENHPSPNNPLGAKGAGEGGIIPVGGAVANAVANALRMNIRELPLSPARLWQQIAALTRVSGDDAEPPAIRLG